MPVGTKCQYPRPGAEAAWLIPCHYSVQEASLAQLSTSSNLLALGGGGRREEREERGKHSAPSPARIDPGLFLGSFPSHIVPKSHNAGSVQSNPEEAAAHSGGPHGTPVSAWLREVEDG
jgi:hypothetical protein